MCNIGAVSQNAVLVNIDTQEVHWIPDGVIEVGRSMSLALPIIDPSLSRSHARLYNVEEGFWVEDLGSTNGTYVRGVILTEPTQVQTGDKVQFGNLVFSYEQRQAFKVDVTTRVPEAQLQEIIETSTTPAESEETGESEASASRPAHTMPSQESVSIYRRKTSRVNIKSVQQEAVAQAESDADDSKPLPSKYTVTDSGRITPAGQKKQQPQMEFQSKVQESSMPPFPWKPLLAVAVATALSLGIIIGFFLGRI
jgi:pSer/pThr/pTyr-binding forkhead associated (FHA) protein